MYTHHLVREGGTKITTSEERTQEEDTSILTDPLMSLFTIPPSFSPFAISHRPKFT